MYCIGQTIKKEGRNEGRKEDSEDITLTTHQLLYALRNRGERLPVRTGLNVSPVPVKSRSPFDPVTGRHTGDNNLCGKFGTKYIGQ